MTFDEYINLEYNELYKIAKKIYGGTKLDPSEVISELYISARNRDINPSKDDYRYYCIRWLKNAKRWQGGNPVKKLYIRDIVTNKYAERKLEILVESTLEGSEIVQDLQRAGFTQDQGENIERVIEISKRLPLYHKRLFELYYIEGYSLNEIALSCSSDTCKIPKVAIHRDVKRVLKEIEISLTNEETI